MEVHDGVFKTSDLIGRYCGTEKPESITSDSWDMRVTFKSSGKTSYPGFKASYKRKSKYERFRLNPGVTPRSWAAPAKRDTFFRLLVYKRVGGRGRGFTS